MRFVNETEKMADTTQVNAAPNSISDLTNMVSPTESTGAMDGASPQSPSEPVNGTTTPNNHLPKNDHPATNGGVTPSDEKKTPTGFKSPPKQDPAKQKEREERVKMLREKQAEEQRKKLEELKEAQKRAQEIREKQLQERQRKILEQRRREEEHRALVEERRRRMESEENEKKMALLKKNAERESKLEAARQSMKQQGVFGFGSSTRRMVCDAAADPTQRAVSQGSLLRRSINDTLEDDAVDADGNSPQRRAISACSLSRKSASAHSGQNQELLTVGPAPDKRLSMSTSQLSPANGKRPTRHSMGSAGSTSNLRATSSMSSANVGPRKPSPKKTRLSGSTSNLGSSTIPGESRMKPAASMGQVNLRHRTPPPNYRVRGNQSENSSGDHSPIRKRRPHSIAGRLPSYAAPTTASEARLGRSEEKKITATSLIAAKNRSKSADVSTMRVSRSSQDFKKSIDRLSMPKVPREPRDRSMPNRPAPKTPATPPVKMQPAVPRALPRETNKAPTPKDKNKQPAPQKGPVKAIHNVNVSTAKKANKPATPQKRNTPSPKTGSPAKERVTPPVSPPPAASPVPGEEKKDEEKKVDREDEYKAKMAAKRKEMREKAEREAEEKRLREEEERRLEEERIRKEEEEERQRIAEEERLAREARKAEEERLQRAIEENERKQEEEERKAEEERIAREEAEKLAKEEAERKEIERVEKLRKEEEERQERRKRLEMIMNRVRPDQADKSDSPSPTKSVSPPSATTPDRELPPNVMTASGSFKSPLLQQMMSKKAQTETGQEQVAEFLDDTAPADDLSVQAEPEVEAAVASETPEAVEDVAQAPAEDTAAVQPSEATPEVEDQAPVAEPAEAAAAPDTVPETKSEPEEVKVETAENKEEDMAEGVVTSAIQDAVAEVGQPVANGVVETHEAAPSENSSPAELSPAHSPRDSNNTSTSVSLDVSPNSSAPASPKREGASSAEEGAAEKPERPFSPASDEDKPKFKSPLLQRMIGNKEKSATKALEDMKTKKSDAENSSSSSSSPVPPKEENEAAEQSTTAELNSDIAELNQVSVEINSDSVAKDSVPTLNGVNHTQEDLNEVSTSICDVNQKKEDISEVSQVKVDDCSTHVDSSELCDDSDAKALTQVSDAHFEVRIAGDDHIEVIKTEMLDVGAVEGAGLDLSENLADAKDDAAAFAQADDSEDLAEVADLGRDVSDTIVDIASSDNLLTKDVNLKAGDDVQRDAEVKAEDAEVKTTTIDDKPLDAEVDAKSLPVDSSIGVAESEGILESSGTGVSEHRETEVCLEPINISGIEDNSEVDIVVTGATPRSVDSDESDHVKEADEAVVEAVDEFSNEKKPDIVGAETEVLGLVETETKTALQAESEVVGVEDVAEAVSEVSEKVQELAEGVDNLQLSLSESVDDNVAEVVESDADSKVVELSHASDYQDVVSEAESSPRTDTDNQPEIVAVSEPTKPVEDEALLESERLELLVNEEDKPQIESSAVTDIVSEEDSPRPDSVPGSDLAESAAESEKDLSEEKESDVNNEVKENVKEIVTDLAVGTETAVEAQSNVLVSADEDEETEQPPACGELQEAIEQSLDSAREAAEEVASDDEVDVSERSERPEGDVTEEQEVLQAQMKDESEMSDSDKLNESADSNLNVGDVLNESADSRPDVSDVLNESAASQQSASDVLNESGGIQMNVTDPLLESDGSQLSASDVLNESGGMQVNVTDPLVESGGSQLSASDVLNESGGIQVKDTLNESSGSELNISDALNESGDSGSDVPTGLQVAAESPEPQRVSSPDEAVQAVETVMTEVAGAVKEQVDLNIEVKDTDVLAELACSDIQTDLQVAAESPEPQRVSSPVEAVQAVETVVTEVAGAVKEQVDSDTEVKDTDMLAESAGSDIQTDLQVAAESPEPQRVSSPDEAVQAAETVETQVAGAVKEQVDSDTEVKDTDVLAQSAGSDIQTDLQMTAESQEPQRVSSPDEAVQAVETVVTEVVGAVKEQVDLDIEVKDTDGSETYQKDTKELYPEVSVDMETRVDEAASKQSFHDNDKIDDSQSEADSVPVGDESIPESDSSPPDSARSAGADLSESQSDTQESPRVDTEVVDIAEERTDLAEPKGFDEKDTSVASEDSVVIQDKTVISETDAFVGNVVSLEETKVDEPEKTDSEKPLDAEDEHGVVSKTEETVQMSSGVFDNSSGITEVKSIVEQRSSSAQDDGESVERSLSNASQLSSSSNEKASEVDSQNVESVKEKVEDLASKEADGSVAVPMVESKEDVQEKADVEGTEKSTAVVEDSTESQLPPLGDAHDGDIKSANNIIEEAPEAKVPKGDTPGEEQYGDHSDIVLPKESHSDEVIDAKAMHESETDISCKEESVSLSTKDESLESEDEVIDHLKFNVSSTIFEEVSEVVDESKDESDEDEVSDVADEQMPELITSENDDDCLIEGVAEHVAEPVYLDIEGRQSGDDDSEGEESPRIDLGIKMAESDSSNGGAFQGSNVLTSSEIAASHYQSDDEDADDIVETEHITYDTQIDNSALSEADGTNVEPVNTDQDLSIDTSLPEATGLSLEAVRTADVTNVESDDCSYEDSPRSVQSVDSVKEVKALIMQSPAYVQDEANDESDSEHGTTKPTDVTNIKQEADKYDEDYEVKSDADDSEVESDDSQPSLKHPQHANNEEYAALEYESDEDQDRGDNDEEDDDRVVTDVGAGVGMLGAPLESQQKLSASDDEIEEEISDDENEDEPVLDKSVEQHKQEDNVDSQEEEEAESASKIPSNAALHPQISKFDCESEGDSDDGNMSQEQSPRPISKSEQFSDKLLCRDSAGSDRDVGSDVSHEDVNLIVHASNPEKLALLDDTVEGDVSPVVSSDFEHLHADSVLSKDTHEADVDESVGNVQFSDKENNKNYRYDDERDEDINIEELKLKFDVDHDDLESVKRRALELGESSGEPEGAERRGSRREYASSGSSSPSQSPKKYMRSDASSPREESIPSDEEVESDAVLGNSAEQGALLDFSDCQQKGQVQDLLTMSTTSNRDELLTSSPYDGDDEAAASKNPFVTGDGFKDSDEERDGDKVSGAVNVTDLDPFGLGESGKSQVQEDDPWKQFTSQGQDLMSMSMAAQEKAFPDDLANRSNEPDSAGSSNPFADPWGATFGGQKVSVDFSLPADKLASAGDHIESGLDFSGKMQSGWQTEYGQPPESAMDVDSPAGGDVSYGKIQSEMYRRHFEDEEEEEEGVETEEEDEEREAGVDNSAKAPTSSLLLNEEDPDLINRNQQPAPLNTEPLDENNASTISAATNEDNVHEILSL